MQERIDGIYDSIITAHDTRKNLEENKDNILPFEMVIATDSNDLLFKDEQGNLRGFFGSSGDINDQIKDQVDKNTIANQANFEAIAVNVKQINDLKIDKLNRGIFTGTADDLAKEADSWKIKAKIIEKAVDLNTIIEPGIYVSDNMDGWVNAPTEDMRNTRFVLQVFKSPIGTISQYFRNMNGNIEHTRAKNPDSDWTTWNTVFNSYNNPISKDTNGWCKLANGMMIQWGEVKVGDKSVAHIKLPVAFSTTSFYPVFTSLVPSQGWDTQPVMAYVQGGTDVIINRSYMQYENNVVKWCAVGY